MPTWQCHKQLGFLSFLISELAHVLSKATLDIAATLPLVAKHSRFQEMRPSHAMPPMHLGRLVSNKTHCLNSLEQFSEAEVVKSLVNLQAGTFSIRVRSHHIEHDSEYGIRTESWEKTYRTVVPTNKWVTEQGECSRLGHVEALAHFIGN